jgi:hypothetical protein
VAGSGGAGGSGGSGGGAPDGGKDAPADRSADGTLPDAPAPDGAGADRPADMTGPPASSLDECFAGLRPLVKSSQVATKASGDGKIRVRLALETGDRLGTSGTVPWDLIRFAIEASGATTCITEDAQLVYRGSLHNCNDKASATAGDVHYEMAAPDRMTTQISALMGSTVLWGPITLQNVTCIPDGKCTSGGPCQ